MKQKLFLTSGGLPSSLRPDFLAFLNADPKKMTVAFIPTAADPEKDRWFVDKAREELKGMGFAVLDIDLKEYNYESLLKKLSSADIIYVNGGNTYYLLYWIRKSGFDKVIRELLERGKIYVGSSAGSIVAGPDIGLAGWEPGGDVNDVKLEDLAGIGMVSFAISPHFQVDSLEKLEKRRQKFFHEVVALSDGQAVKVTNEEYEIVGTVSKDAII